MLNIHLHDKVYLIGYFKDSITEVTVEMIGEDSFAHSYSFNTMFIDEFREPCHVDEEGSRWFRTLKEAKDFLHKLYPKSRICKVESDYWEVYFR